MPQFQLIELVWQHGEHYVSRNYSKGWAMNQVWDQWSKGWYGDPKWEDGRGWAPAECKNLVGHTERVSRKRGLAISII